MHLVLPALALSLLAGLLPAPARGETPSDAPPEVAECVRRIHRLMADLSAAESDEQKAKLARTLGAMRAAAAAEPLVDMLVGLHRQTDSPFREPESPGHALAVALVEALREIGRPGLEPFLDALSTWERYALDLTWAYVEVHGEEGILVLRHRARTEEEPERRARLEAAAWFTRLRAPELKEETESPPSSSPVSKPRTR